MVAMTGLFSRFGRLLSRFRHPVSLPEDVAIALGFDLSNFLSLEQLLQQFRRRAVHPSRLIRFMPRKEAESAFSLAVRCERFGCHTICSYHFQSTWLEFRLQFDDCDRLRRVYVLHKEIAEEEGIELPLIRY